jgi:aspartate/tyrosine/aromatic aminotransferase
VETILNDTELRDVWRDELRAMRLTMLGNRAALAEALRAETGRTGSGIFAGNRGMFSLIGATPEQVAVLRETHGIYVVGDGRMNVAGLTPGPFRAWPRRWRRCLRRPWTRAYGAGLPERPSLRPPCQNGKST